MTSFVHIDQSVDHQGLNRAGNAIQNVRQSAAGRRVSRGGLAVPVVIIAGAILLAVGNQLTTNEVNGAWMVAWIAFCAIVFGILALSASTLKPSLSAWSQRRASARADAQFYATALNDPRIMQDLQAARTRHEASTTRAPAAVVSAEAAPSAQAVRMPTLYEAMRSLN